MTQLRGSTIFDSYEKAYSTPFIGMMYQLVKSGRPSDGTRVRLLPSARRSGRRLPTRIVVSVTVLLALAGPTAASAVVLPSDVVGDSTVAASPELRSVAPDVSMRRGVLVADDGRVLWARDPDRRSAMASITKVMTALVVMDRLALTEKVKITSQAASVGESEAGLRAGDVLTVKDALAAMLVKSANDAALALAIRTAGSEKKFVALMNTKARELGMTGTRFANAHGLDEPGHYSTAADIAIMSRVAMREPVFRDIVRRRTVRLARAGVARTYDASNELLGTYRGADGVKTGWTSDAGYSFVASARRGGVSLVAVVLGATSDAARFRQAEELLDWGFDHYRAVRVATAGSVAGTVTVSDYIDRDVLALVARDETATVFDVDGVVQSRPSLPGETRAPVEEGSRLGAMRVTQGTRLLANVPLVSDQSVPKPGFFERMSIAVQRLWSRIFG